MEEQKTIDRALAGDPSAFETLLRAHEKNMFAICIRIFQNYADAEDCLQEAMLRVYRSLGSFKRESALSTWIYRITTNTCLDELRRRKSRPSTSIENLMDNGWAPMDESSGPEEIYMTKELQAAMHRFILELPPDMRIVIVLRDINHFSYDEIASYLSVNVGTVKSRISRARKKLKEIISQHPELFSNPDV